MLDFAKSENSLHRNGITDSEMEVTLTRVPICPGCGAKFSHSQALMACSQCGIGDEIVVAGPRAIARWKRNPVSKARPTVAWLETLGLPLGGKRQRKRARKTWRQQHRRHYGNKHGRVGVRYASR